MKQFWLYLIILLSCAGCHDELTLPKQNLRRVVVVYMMAENSLSGAAQSDLGEIRSAMKQIPDSCAVVVYLDNSRTDIRPQIISFTNQGEKLLLNYGADQVSTDSTVMANALKYIIKKQAADSYGLVLWSHGSGWLPAKHTIGIDNNRNTYANSGKQMEISELKWALKQVGKNWDFILFDACFMQCVEVAYELKELTKWCIGSPAEIPFNGAPYHKLMPAFFSPDNYAQNIAEQYFCEEEENDGILISAIRCDKLESLAHATAQGLSTIEDYPTDGIQQYCIYSANTGWKTEYYDMGSCMAHWLSPENYAIWKEALNAAAPYRYSTSSWGTSYADIFHAQLTDAGNVAGLSIYIPKAGRTEYNRAWKETAWYSAVGHFIQEQ